MILLGFGFVCVLIWIFTKKKKVNPYVNFHKLKIKNDRNYNEYLKWCLSVGEIPMDKYDYIKEVTRKEKEINNLTK